MTTTWVCAEGMHEDEEGRGVADSRVGIHGQVEDADRASNDEAAVRGRVVVAGTVNGWSDLRIWTLLEDVREEAADEDGKSGDEDQEGSMGNNTSSDLGRAHKDRDAADACWDHKGLRTWTSWKVKKARTSWKTQHCSWSLR